MSDLRLALGNTLLALNVATEAALIILLVASLPAVLQIAAVMGVTELLIADQALRQWNRRRKATA